MSMSIQDPHEIAQEAFVSVPKECCVLVADDDASIVYLLTEDLKGLGHKVIQAHDGQMAIRMARQYRPDLLVLDVNMPMTSGLKVMEYLRASPETARIPIIFITGEMSKNVFPLIESIPRVALVKKPFDLDGLNSLIRQFLKDYPTT